MLQRRSCLRPGLTVMVGADLEGSVSPHQDADGASLFVLEQLDVAGPPLLPLRWVDLGGKAVQFGPPGGEGGFNTYWVGEDT